MAQRLYRVAVIGCGHMGEEHVKRLYDKEYIELSYACDLDKERAERFCRRYGVLQAVTDRRVCLEDPAVDILLVSTYPDSHLTILKECIQYHKHLLCEKPVAADLAHAEEFIRLVRENPGTKVLIGHILRHNKTYQKVAEMIRQGAIGFPIVCRMSQNHHTMDWKKYLALLRQASPLVDCGVHYVDVMRWFTGAEVVSIQAVGARTEEDLAENEYNYGLMSLRLSDGSVGYYEAGWGNTMSSDNLKEFSGPRGRIRIIYQELRDRNHEEGDLIEYYRYPEKQYEMINIRADRKPADLQFDYLIRMIETGCEANPDIGDVEAALKVCLEADRKIRSQLLFKPEEDEHVTGS